MARKIVDLIGSFVSFFINCHIKKVIIAFACAINSASFRRCLKKHGKSIRIMRHNRFESLENIIIGDDFIALDGLWLATYSEYFNIEYSPSIIIGNNVHLSRNCHIAAINKIVIDNNVLVGSNVLITDHMHGNTNDFSAPRCEIPLISKGEIHIGENTFIGDNTCILSGVSIGKNCVIGANSIVNKSFPNNSLIGGNPAKLIKKLEEK